jgi:predicted nucleotidyltransferase
MAKAFPKLAQLATDHHLETVAKTLVGLDGRRIRKTVTEAMLGRMDTVIDPGALTIDDLKSAASRVHTAENTKATQGVKNGTH